MCEKNIESFSLIFEMDNLKAPFLLVKVPLFLMMVIFTPIEIILLHHHLQNYILLKLMNLISQKLINQKELKLIYKNRSI